MNKKYVKNSIWCAALIIALLCTSCGKQGTAAVMRLIRTEGDVGITDEKDKEVSVNENRKLYSGYGLKTEKESFAWINLDSVKLAKMDESSEAEIQKKGKKLEILTTTGNLFFHVTEPLEEDETMNIRNSTMSVGIRGTCGWVESPNEKQMNVYIIEGRVECNIEEPSGGKVTEEVSSWEMAEMAIDKDGKGTIITGKFTEQDIPDFVKSELDGADISDQPDQDEKGKTKEEGEGEVLDTDGSLDFESYVGSYTCDETGAILTIGADGMTSIGPGSNSQGILSPEGILEPLPSIVSHNIKIADGVLYAVSVGEEREGWTMTPQNGRLIVEFNGYMTDYYAKYYEGTYHK